MKEALSEITPRCQFARLTLTLPRASQGFVQLLQLDRYGICYRIEEPQLGVFTSAHPVDRTAP